MGPRVIGKCRVAGVLQGRGCQPRSSRILILGRLGGLRHRTRVCSGGRLLRTLLLVRMGLGARIRVYAGVGRRGTGGHVHPLEILFDHADLWVAGAGVGRARRRVAFGRRGLVDDRLRSLVGHRGPMWLLTGSFRGSPRTCRRWLGCWVAGRRRPVLCQSLGCGGALQTTQGGSPRDAGGGISGLDTSAGDASRLHYRRLRRRRRAPAGLCSGCRGCGGQPIHATRDRHPEVVLIRIRRAGTVTRARNGVARVAPRRGIVRLLLLL